MAKKNTKTKKKHQKVDQTPDLQEFEGTEITENSIEETENPVTEITEMTENIENPEDSVEDTEMTENQEDESETTMGMVYCKKCGVNVDPYSTEKGWRCPVCNKFVESPEMKKGGETIREVKASKDRPYELMSSRNIKFSGNELAQAEMLIQSGVAKDFHELAKLAFNVLFLKEKINKAFGNQTNAMELNKEPNPERTMKEIQQQEMMKAYIEGMRKGNQPNPMEMMMMQRQMENMDKGKSSSDNNFMDKMMQLQMMKMMSGGENQQILALQREIADLKQQQQIQQMMNQQTQMQQSSQSSQQFMQEMEKIRSERDQTIKQAEIIAQQERDKNLQLAFDNRRIELESRLQAMEKEMKESGGGKMAAQRLQQMKDDINAVKEMSSLLGNREKGAGEYIGETITNVASQLQPAITKYMEQRERQREMQQPQQYFPPETYEQPQQFPENPGPPEPSILEQNQQQFPGNPEIQLIPSDMTETEKQMSDTMSDMYIKRKKR